MTEDHKPQAPKLPPVPIFDGHALTARQRAFGTAFAALAGIELLRVGAPPKLVALIRDRLLAPLHAAQEPMGPEMQTASQAYTEAVLKWYGECAAAMPRIVPVSKPNLKVI